MIPGRKEYKASHPVPPDGANNIKSSINALMFRESLNYDHHIVHFD